jgi:hypothetical protein
MLNYPPEMLITRKGKDVCGEISMGGGEGGGCVCVLETIEPTEPIP